MIHSSFLPARTWADLRGRAFAIASGVARDAINLLRPFVQTDDALKLQGEGALLRLLAAHAGAADKLMDAPKLLLQIILERNEAVALVPRLSRTQPRGQA